MNQIDYTYKPIAREEIKDVHMVFMDEEDNTLYTCQNPHGDQSESENQFRIFIHNNIVFKLCSPHDMVYTNCFDTAHYDAQSTVH